MSWPGLTRPPSRAASAARRDKFSALAPLVYSHIDIAFDLVGDRFTFGGEFVEALVQTGIGAAAFGAGFSRLNPALQSAAQTIFANQPHIAGWLGTILNGVSPSFPTAATYATLQKPQDGKP